MGHYDNCRPGYCAACGQAEGIVWDCGRRNCSSYHIFLKEHDIIKYLQLMNDLDKERRPSAGPYQG